MSRTDQSRVETKMGVRHQEGPHHHFTTPSQDKRIRQVFGLADEAPIPAVSDTSLAIYHDFLVANLKLPFEALYCQNGGELRQLIHYVRVVELSHPRNFGGHVPHGLLCRAQNVKQVMDLPLDELGVRDDNPNCQLLDDYAYWFVNWR
jgi:hypothetical protein